ncbi:phenylalanine--tRNA ligase subunit beta [Youngiibacter fragilis]|uniref:Phenylalanine--tRNA ligase beta subunit n=1 Tax=Youngiibacter fragilis 232.1 TaxID=994573 RepID=V7I1W7_9CLOT|nr:phenylalanine--tRNA ligase subunit beta [Youngiibacter fragilis]ETA80230.1 phenylalanyl-tRNA synthetase subunit beta [Youngiibacter fragilis 232.1]
MKLPVNWLKDYVDVDIDIKTLGDRLTMSGSKVEGIEETFKIIENVVTGKIVELGKHPEADKLFVCQVDTGNGSVIQIVTAATNMKEGDTIPVALHGSTLWGGLKIKKGKLRGVESNGMFCSMEELGLAEEGTCDGLMILKDGTPLGKDIKDVLGLNGGVLDLEITSNRPDCLSMLGMARETAATLGLRLRQPGYSYTATAVSDEPVSVSIDTDKCRRYMAKEIVNVKIEESPEWIQSRLLEAGVRPINNIVDLTNFVMLELGQPLHAFDRREITSGTIRIAESVEGTKFTTLDSVERTLNSGTVLIQDDSKVIGLGGIMGGLDSEIKEDTTRIILEAANFDGVSIRRSEGFLGLKTEASLRFNKDIDPNLCELAVNRFCSLVQELKAGDIVSETVDVYNARRVPNTISLGVSYVNSFIGTDISGEEMVRILESLDMKAELDGDILTVTTPTFRGDLNIKEDITEEIARIYGYDRIPATVPSIRTVRSGKYPVQRMRDTLKQVLVASGLYESIAYSFISRKDLDKVLVPADSDLRKVVEIRNPLGEDYSIMRTTSVPSMMENLSRNLTRSNPEAALFEIGRIYLDRNEVLPLEKEVLTVGMYGGDLLFEVKGLLETIFEEFGIEKVAYDRSKKVAYHPGKSADVSAAGEAIGTFGEIHPSVLDNYGIDVPCYVLELDLDTLYRKASLARKYSQLPKYPAITRDLAVLVDDSVLSGQIEAVITKQGGALLESVKLFDVYKGLQVPEGKKSIAYSLVYRNQDRTLTDGEVQKVHDKILRSLEYQLGAVLR